MTAIRTLVVGILASALWPVAPVAAQPLGTFRWQMQPFCNVVTVVVTQQGGQFLLDGTDDQCGAPQLAGVRGVAFQNPSGSVGFGLTIVTAPGGTAAHVDAAISLTTLSGTWRDDAGNSGPYIFTPGAGVPGAPRPVAVGGVYAWARINSNGTVLSCFRCDTNPAQTQKIATGQYEVAFLVGIAGRPRLASYDTHGTFFVIPGGLSLADRSGDPTSVAIRTSAADGTATDRSFTIFVF